MVRFGSIFVLGSLLITSSAAAQLPLASRVWAPELSAASVSLSDSSSPRHFTFQPIQAEAQPRHKSPFLAWFLSWAVPGGGQAYNGQWGKAALFFVPAAIGTGIVVSQSGFSCTADCGTRDAGLVILAAAAIGSQVEAPISASRINREARRVAASGVKVRVASISF